jgi:hypothetical protein
MLDGELRDVVVAGVRKSARMADQWISRAD